MISFVKGATEFKEMHTATAKTAAVAAAAVQQQHRSDKWEVVQELPFRTK